MGNVGTEAFSAARSFGIEIGQESGRIAVVGDGIWEIPVDDDSEMDDGSRRNQRCPVESSRLMR